MLLLTPFKITYNLRDPISYCIICVKCFNTKQNYFNYIFEYLNCSFPKVLKPTDVVIFFNVNFDNPNVFIPFCHEYKQSVTVDIALLRLDPFTKTFWTIALFWKMSRWDENISMFRNFGGAWGCFSEVNEIIYSVIAQHKQCQWPRDLRHGSEASRLLGLRVRMPPGAWMPHLIFVSCQVEVEVSG